MAVVFMAEECPQTGCVYIPSGNGSSETCGGSSGVRVAPTAPIGGTPPPAATPRPSTPVPQPGIFQFGTYEFHAAHGGSYGGSVTVTGHTVDISGIKRVFDLNAGRTTGEEICIFTAPEIDWNYFGGPPGPQESPYTIAGDGGYAHGLTDCLFGQYILGHFWYWWRNAENPTVNEIVPPNGDPTWGDFGFTKCLTVIEMYNHEEPPYEGQTFCDVFN